ncbi:major facilitator superfamily domain-containing protein [Phaeosphaeriaceae sp. PMI808]|nr:major facilitator superfamily domain-containing protein [Phaeosphaeriaceae sp. PMI808]
MDPCPITIGSSCPKPSFTHITKTRGTGFWRCFISICIPLLLSVLEGSVTNTALPTISDALTTAFLLAGTIFQPLFGQFGDIGGRKYPMIIVVFLFATGSVICGAANSGLGTGGIDLFAETILCDPAPYLAIKHTVFGIGTSLGPLFGGIFAEHRWRWCFLINIPICAIWIVTMWAGLEDELKKVDYIGSGILTTFVVMVLVALSTGGAPRPRSHPAIVVPLVVGLIGFIIFVFWKRSPYCKHPIMSPQVFSNCNTNITFTLTMIHSFITYRSQFFLSPFFQAVKGRRPLLSFWGKYKPMHIIGFGLATTGLNLGFLLNSQTPVTVWLCFQLITASGLGIVISTMLPAVQVKLPESTTAASAGSWAFLRGTSSLFGVAIPSAIFNMRFAHLTPAVARSKVAHGRAYECASAKFTKGFGAAAKEEIIFVFTASLKTVWIVFAVMAALAFVLAWGEKEYKMRTELDTALYASAA